MRRAVAGLWDVPLEGVNSALAVVAVSFLLGGVAGCIFCANVTGVGNESLSAYMEGFLSLAQSGGVIAPKLLPLIWEILRWPLVTLVLSVTALGLIGIPALFAVRGFLLSFAISSFSRMFGMYGGLMAAAVFGVSGLFSLSALFILGVQGFASARSLAGRAVGVGGRSLPFGKAYILRCGVCAGAFFLCILLEYFAVPVIVSGIAGVFPV